MYGSTFGRSASAYSKVGVETGVSTASPHKLILMLFDGALMAIAIARSAMENNQIALKGEKISHAINIIANGLKVSLDFERGGEIAERLVSLYDYMIDRLLAANLHNDLGALDEVAALLREIKGAWEGIGDEAEHVVA